MVVICCRPPPERLTRASEKHAMCLHRMRDCLMPCGSAPAMHWHMLQQLCCAAWHGSTMQPFILCWLGLLCQSMGPTGHVHLQDVRLVRSLLQRHSRYTNSPRAKALLSDWNTARGHFVKIYPHEFRRAMEEADKTKVCPLRPLTDNTAHTFSMIQDSC